MEMTRPDVFRRIREMGAARAVVPFHGGNDEGFTEDITLESADGSPVAVIDEDYYGTEESFEGAQELAEALSRPVYDEYGGFAGDFEVEGRVIWDVSRGTISMEGSETAECSKTDWAPFEKGL